MTAATHADIAGHLATPAEVGAKYIRWGFGLFIFGLVLDTPQRYPRAGSQSYPTPAAVANADGSTTVYFGASKPAGVSDGNWVQTDPRKGWFTILRLYSPLEPFFTKAWRPSEIELVN